MNTLSVDRLDGFVDIRHIYQSEVLIFAMI